MMIQLAILFCLMLVGAGLLYMWQTAESDDAAVFSWLLIAGWVVLFGFVSFKILS
ncbi:hypothetical protein phiOC_p313 [Ochrobactrum phage vB_OspM_OC]|nr:hypothetical protein phiOC_p313 [Ochrobactrum phage vB_OspM_OC]